MTGRLAERAPSDPVIERTRPAEGKPNHRWIRRNPIRTACSASDRKHCITRGTPPHLVGVMSGEGTTCTGTACSHARSLEPSGREPGCNLVGPWTSQRHSPSSVVDRRVRSAVERRPGKRPSGATCPSSECTTPRSPSMGSAPARVSSPTLHSVTRAHDSWSGQLIPELLVGWGSPGSHGTRGRRRRLRRRVGARNRCRYRGAMDPAPGAVLGG